MSRIFDVTLKNDRSNPGRDGMKGVTTQTVTFDNGKKALSITVEWTGPLAEKNYISPGHPGPWKWTEYGKERLKNG